MHLSIYRSSISYSTAKTALSFSLPVVKMMMEISGYFFLFKEDSGRGEGKGERDGVVWLLFIAGQQDVLFLSFSLPLINIAIEDLDTFFLLYRLFDGRGARERGKRETGPGGLGMEMFVVSVMICWTGRGDRVAKGCYFNICCVTPVDCRCPWIFTTYGGYATAIRRVCGARGGKIGRQCRFLLFFGYEIVVFARYG